MKRLRASVACGTFFLGVCVVPGTIVRATVGSLETVLERGSGFVSQLIVSYEQDVALTESPMMATGSALIGQRLTPGLDLGLGMRTVLLDRAVSVSDAHTMAAQLTADPRIEWAEPDLQMSVPTDATRPLTPIVSRNTMATPQSVPSSPTNIRVQPSSGSILVRWVKPVNHGTSAITSYTARAHSLPSGGTRIASCTSTKNSCSITGLSDGSTYWISVAAKNSGGTGFSSSPRVSSTPPFFNPNDPYYVNSELWGFNGTYGVQAQKAWLVTRGTSEIVVAVLDTGSTVHPDLEGQTVPGYDMISDIDRAGDGNGRDSDPSDAGDFFGDKLSSWHGTHIAGIINARGNNSLGVIGIAPNVKVQHVRVLGRDGGSDSDIVSGITWASGGQVGSLPLNPTPARVINLSLGGEGVCPQQYQTAINEANSRGTVIVVAAGNSNVPASTFVPANCDGVITVAASNRDGQKASFSNFGSVVDIAAPGTDIKSTMNAGLTGPGLPTYALKSGTSMAAPYVAGVVALMLSNEPSLTPADVETRIKNQSNQTFLVQGDWGIINAALLLGVPEIPQSPTNVAAIRSGPTTTTRTVSWSAASSGSAATTHIARAYLRPSGDSPVMWCSTVNLACDLSNLVKGATYYLDVISGNTGGYSAPSGTRLAINTKGPVANVVPTLTTGPTRGSVKVSWSSGLDSSLMDSYLIQYSTDLLSWKNGPEVEIRSLTLVVGLESGVNYRFRVVSKKDSGSFIKISRESAQTKPS
ncbi:MAG: S8 family serine peptidase [Actinobacteria bacterium]|nr:S8 family serine peptidase [Actinomycetota bacterium]